MPIDDADTEKEIEAMKERLKDFDSLAHTVKYFFTNLTHRTVGDRMNEAASVCDALSGMLRQPYKLTERDRAIARAFESIYLWVADHLSVAPSSVLQQVQQIVAKSDLCEVLASIATLNDEQITRLRVLTRNDIVSRVTSQTLRILYGITVPQMQRKYLTQDSIFEAKVGLQRLAGVLRYAAESGTAEDYDVYGGLEDHYSPVQVNLQKIQGLIERARFEAQSVSDIRIQQRILERLEIIESELKRSGKIRWTIIITASFALLGFLADLKSVHEPAYETLASTVTQLLAVVHEDGQVHAKQRNNATFQLELKRGGDTKTTDRQRHPAEHPFVEKRDEIEEADLSDDVDDEEPSPGLVQ